jgi:glucosamine 6-phosphate synthetase-like amidotransferase/phosphosugar isomerase protein
MCGIVGVLGKHEVAPLLVEALKRLEYRGYDSAGIATVNNGRLDRRRAVGKLVNLSDLLVHEPLAGKSGIGHTRWATHGAATVANAHPHKAGGVAVVHNGIIENYEPLKAGLIAKGVKFLSETDTEVIGHLINEYFEGDLVKAVHDRIPVILPRPAYRAWLDPAYPDPLGLLRPLPAGQMTRTEVDPLLGSPREDHPDLLRPWTPAQTSLFDP